MLSRTADHLYWLARYTERAENLARLLDVSYQMSLLPQSIASQNENWRAILALNSLEDAFAEVYDEVNVENVLHFMVSDPANPSSIHSCLRAARENAHAVRGTLTAEMWESVNATWLELRQQQFDHILARGISEFFDWVKLRSALIRGVTFGTMLRDDALHFIRLGGLLERGDNTARILDMQYHVLRQNGDEAATDFYRWSALLRSVSAFQVYRKVYSEAITPARVAELLILRMDMPRSLHACADGIVRMLQLIANSVSAETERQAGVLHARLHFARIDDVLAGGLHAYLSDFMDRIYDLGDGISRDFLVAA
ncbi:MAG TPA: alpha-E domain-containing protein [Accumulibacter sp.]|uniref:alpha-E domain-containing protein n=4 Tax=Accumulibacter sp. TaxID=2053492 RepID=UPI00287883B2|nr:alpha-E domain-containing protein [Accumulibacter sp.]MDS4053573.1 alpha-E domain-containing protein [Accumulibacter sp.]HMV05429.1 alpha-E domain-containing protein [Accumulibacter sp.]HMW62803.1 alpha-E domain-containing protein [Accumulibacter sp.]HMW79679.1 alpha-E domain-containing protein [Accumulibacter sp.]HMX68132.1 alpha-E domain-containing protein [Accumulibacter sp.]